MVGMMCENQEERTKDRDLKKSLSIQLTRGRSQEKRRTGIRSVSKTKRKRERRIFRLKQLSLFKTWREEQEAKSQVESKPVAVSLSL